MQFIRTLIVSSAVLAFAGSALADGSAAFGLSASFSTGGINTGLSPANKLVSAGANKYDKTVNSGAYHKVVTLATGLAPPSMTVDVANLRSRIQGMVGKDGYITAGEATATGFSLTIQGPKGAGPGVTAPPFLKITANSLKETGSYNDIIPSPKTATGEAAIGGLVVSGTLLGDKTVKFTGTPKAGKLLYHSDMIDIVLNRQTTTSLISCNPTCAVTPYGIDANAIEITLTDALMGERQVTGKITIGAGHAGVENEF